MRKYPLPVPVVAALQRWATAYGRNWKAALRNVWASGRYGVETEDTRLLAALRDTHGLRWLDGYLLPDAYKGKALIITTGLLGIRMTPTASGILKTKKLIADDVEDVDRAFEDRMLRCVLADFLQEDKYELFEHLRYPELKHGSRNWVSDVRDPVAYFALGHAVLWRFVGEKE